MKRISKKQKRAKYTSKRGAEAASEHLLLRDQHDEDRKAADKLRGYPNVPRLKQAPFPKDREVGFAGHWKYGQLVLQSPDEFKRMNVECKKDCWYWKIDKRPGRNPRPLWNGLAEVNVAMSSGLARELAKLVKAGDLKEARRILKRAAEAGMAELAKRTGYKPCYVAVHPDAEGTMSFHYGLWPIDKSKRCLIGRSAGGKRGRRGFRTLGDGFTSILRHHRAIGLPAELVSLPYWNLRSRHPDDWMAAKMMDRTVYQELAKMSNGEEILAAAAEYQREAARDWLARFNAGTLGVQKMHDRLGKAEAKLKRQKQAAERLLSKAKDISKQKDIQVVELENENSELKVIQEETWSFFERVAAVPSLVAMLQGVGKEIWNIFVKITDFLGIEVSNPKRLPNVAELQDQNDQLKFQVQSLIESSVELLGRADAQEIQLRHLTGENEKLRAENEAISRQSAKFKAGPESPS